MAMSSPAKDLNRLPKRKSDEDIDVSKLVWRHAEGGNDAKRSRHEGSEDENFATQYFDDTVKEEKKTKKSSKEPEIICLDDSSDEDEDENDGIVPPPGFGQPSLSPGAAAAAVAMQEWTVEPAEPFAVAETATAAPGADGPGGEAEGAEGQWRCVQCTFLNEEFASKCGMCNDDDSGDGGNASDDLAKFLGGSGFFESAGGEGNSNHSFVDAGAYSRHSCSENYTGTGDGNSQQDQQQQRPQYRALQSADARELETLAEHVSSGGSLPKQAHQNIDEFWADTFPQILLLS